MSVPKSKRTTSPLEYYVKAVKIREQLAVIMLHNFGIKPKVRQPELVAKSAKMTDDDKAYFLALLTKYNLNDKIIEHFPTWWIEERRRTVDQYASKVVFHIRMGESIYPTVEADYLKLREHQLEAIGYLNMLNEELQFVVNVLHEVLGIDLNKYYALITLIIEESKLLQRWKKNSARSWKKYKESKGEAYSSEDDADEMTEFSSEMA